MDYMTMETRLLASLVTNEKIARAEAVADLAERLACAPFGSLVASDMPNMPHANIAVYIFDRAEALITEREKRVAEAGGKVSWSTTLDKSTPRDVKNDLAGLRYFIESHRNRLANGRTLDCPPDLAEDAAAIFRAEGWHVEIEHPVGGRYTYLNFGKYTKPDPKGAVPSEPEDT